MADKGMKKKMDFPLRRKPGRCSVQDFRTFLRQKL